MRIVLDAMGSDNNPIPDIAGGVLAAREFREPIILVGDQALIASALQAHDTAGLPLEVIHAPQVITMTDKPVEVGKTKPQSSMHIGLQIVKEGRAEAFVTAGNTGAAMAIATLFTLKRLPEVKRPALCSIVRVMNGKSIILLDIGANADSKPEWLVQFALMGQIYAQYALGIGEPTVALLSNGEEETKGNQLTHDATPLLTHSIRHFKGNIEPREILQGHADVVVSDGFTGNIMIKSFEAMASTLLGLLRTEIKQDPLAVVGALLARGAFSRVRGKVDPSEIGGAPLLGVNGVVIIGHGRSNAAAIKNAVRQARAAVQGNITERIKQHIGQTHPI